MRLLFHEPRKGGCQNAFSLLGSLCTAERQECSEIIRGFAAEQVCIQVFSPIPALWLWVNSFNLISWLLRTIERLYLFFFHWETLMRKYSQHSSFPSQPEPLGGPDLRPFYSLPGLASLYLSWTWPCSPLHLPLTQPYLLLLQVSMLGSRLFNLEDFG